MLGKLLLTTAVVLAAIHSTSAQAWSASTEWDANYRADRADIDTVEDASTGLAGSWSSRNRDQYQWLMRDLGEVSVVTGVTTKGRNYNPAGWGFHNQYVTSYTISYGVNNGDEAFYTDAAGQVVVFTGNTDRDTPVTHNFGDYNGPVTARYVKIHPRTWNQHISMRAEIEAEPLVPVDIVLTLDLSSSISRSDHNDARNFMDNLHQCPVLQDKNVQVGIVLYNCVPWTHVTLGEYAIGSGILMYRIMDIEYTGGRTRTGPAIRHARVTSDFREESKRAVIVLTDGVTEDPAGMAAEAAAALSEGINLYGVGVGTFASPDGLQDITGDSQRIFTVNSDPCIAAQTIMDDLNA